MSVSVCPLSVLISHSVHSSPRGAQLSPPVYIRPRPPPGYHGGCVCVCPQVVFNIRRVVMSSGKDLKVSPEEELRNLPPLSRTSQNLHRTSTERSDKLSLL